MKTIEINMKHYNTVEEIHHYLKMSLDFPSYYGCNLDALYDELTSLCEPVGIRLILTHDEQSPSFLFGKKILRVLKDAEKENKNIHLITGW